MPTKEFDLKLGGRPGTGTERMTVTHTHTEALPTDDQALWGAIRNRTEAIGFRRYSDFIERLFCSGKEEDVLTPLNERRNREEFNRNLCISSPIETRLSIHAVDSFNVLKLATEVFLLLECGVVVRDNNVYQYLLPPKDGTLFSESEESSRMGNETTLAELQNAVRQYLGGGDGKLPYLERILQALVGPDPEKLEVKIPFCAGVLQHRAQCPCLLELIWSYWLEEGMLVQTMNAIALRFQNRRGAAERDPLVEMEMDPLRPLNNLLWGYVQNEYNRLTVPRRAYEYDHHYGLTLYGKAAPKLRSADSRSRFLEGFHNLLYRAAIFYHEDADTTVIADAFPLLNSLREVHLVMAEGAHNQFGDLPWTSRVEMMMEQWLLSRPEMTTFLRGRAMVPYREAWMGGVDAMKKIQGWTDTSITQFQDLAAYGEQLLLSIRYGDWIDVNDQNQAKNWARYWKPEVQSYIHAYRAVTGVDLTSDPVDATPPWVHLKRLEGKKRAGRR